MNELSCIVTVSQPFRCCKTLNSPLHQHWANMWCTIETFLSHSEKYTFNAAFWIHRRLWTQCRAVNAYQAANVTESLLVKLKWKHHHFFWEPLWSSKKWLVPTSLVGRSYQWIISTNDNKNCWELIQGLLTEFWARLKVW